METVALWRGHGSQFLSARRKMQQRMVFNSCGKLIGYLRSHKRVGDAVLLEIII